MEVINSAHGLYCERCMYAAPGPKGEIISKKKNLSILLTVENTANVREQSILI